MPASFHASLAVPSARISGFRRSATPVARESRPWARITSAWFAFAVFVTLARALPAPSAAYSVTQWDTETGLPHNAVKRIYQTKDGYLWVGTDQGLARFDGIRFTVFNERNTGGAVSAQVTSFAETRDGSLWIATANGLARYRQGVFTSYNATSGIRTTSGVINSLCIDAAGVLWIGTQDGITRWADEKFYQGVDTSGYDMRGMRSLCVDAKGAVWMTLTTAVLRYDRGAFSLFDEAQGLPRNITTVTTDASGRVLALSYAGIYALTGDRFVPAEFNAKLASPNVNEARADRLGNLWVGSVGGLDRIVNDLVAPCYDRLGRPIGVVAAILEDREGCVWVGTANGLYRFIKPRGYSFAADDRLTRVGGVAVTEARDGALWVASYGQGVDRIMDGGVTHYSMGAPLSHDVVKCIYEAPDGSMWFGTRGSTVDHMVDGRVTTYVYEPGIATSRNVTVIHATRDGSMLLGVARRGLLQIKDERIVPVEGAEALATDSVYAINELDDGRLLIGTSRGVFERKNAQQWVPLEMKGLPSRPVVRAMLPANDGALWFATDGLGLVRWRNGTARMYETGVGLIDDTFFSVLRDDVGNLWVSSTKGIARIRESDFDEIDRGKIATLNCTSFGRADGLLSSSSAGAGFPAAALLRDGRLITGTDRGFAVLEPRAIQTNAQPPNVIIESVTADDRAVVLADKIIVPAGANRLEFHFTALSFIAPERIRFRYRLLGSDSRWVDDNQRTATYTHLAPGPYTFHVLACNNDGVWNDVGASLAVEILPRFYQTLPFRISVFVLGVGAIASVVGFTVRRQMQERVRELEKQQALEKERARIARDLHDELGAGLTEAGLLADELADTGPREFSPQLSGLAWRIRRLGTDLSGIVWTMNLKHSTLAHLAQFVRRYAERLFRNTGTRCSVSGVDSIPSVLLGPTTRHEVLASVKEALNNVIKHAQAKEAHVRLSYSEGVFEVHITDDGRGFMPSPTAGAHLDGNGLRNMRTRMEEIQGVMELISAPGKGTQVVFRVPCPRSPRVN